MTFAELIPWLLGFFSLGAIGLFIYAGWIARGFRDENRKLSDSLAAAQASNRNLADLQKLSDAELDARAAGRLRK